MQEIQSAEKLFKRECNFAIGAVKIDDIPTLELPEFTFIGRSNVGKSSLINALLYRNSLARVSQNPGCTKQINFYNLNDKIHLVDLPGYGFARVGRDEKKGWDRLIHDYLRGRKQLRRAFVLIDSRHEIKKSDTDTMKFLDDFAVNYQLIFTKIDKTPQKTLDHNYNHVCGLIQKFSACHPVILKTSSETKDGIQELREEIFTLARQ